jgi:hypothetical protein
MKPNSSYPRLLPGALLAALLLPQLTIRAAATAPQYPFRLRLSVRTNTITAGDRIPLIIEFLDRDYQQISNDRGRLVSFTQNPITTAAAGEILPNPLPVPGNARSSSQATFQGRHPGKLSIRAECEGLQPYEIIVSIHAASVSALSRLLDFTVHAQGDVTEPPFHFCRKDLQPAPANGKSPVTLQVCLKDLPTEELRVRVETEPGCQVSYKNKSTRTGVLEFILDRGDDLSDEIDLTSSEPRTFNVQAYVMGKKDSLRDNIPVRFLPRSPASIILDGLEEVTSVDSTVLLTVGFADDAGTPIRQLDCPHTIEISAGSHPELMDLSAKTLVLTPDRSTDVSPVGIKGFPENKELDLLAQDKDHPLKGMKTIKLNGPLPGITLLLLFLAGAGGIVGGVTRHVFKSHSKSFLPKRVNGHLKLGFIGNLPFSSLFGAILFLAIRLGGTGIGGGVALNNLTRSDSMIFACFFGVLGGFAGILVLDRLVGRLLPHQQVNRARVKAAHG